MASLFVANLETDRIKRDRYGLAMLVEWLRKALAHAGIGQAELARQLTERLERSIDRAAVNKMTTGKRGIAADEMLAIEAITGFPAPTDEEADGRVRRIPIEEDEAEHARTGEAGPGSGVSSVGPYRGQLPGAIPDLEVNGGAGPGEMAVPYMTTDGNGITYSADAVRGEIVLPDYLLGEYTRTRPGRVHAIRVRGDSMETTLSSGDRVFADTADTAIGQGGIFVIVDHRHAEVLVKRLRREGRGETARIVLVSDNTKQGNEDRDPDEVTIVGRAVARLTRL